MHRAAIAFASVALLTRFAVAAPAGSSNGGAALTLPPYFVTESWGGQPWRHGTLPGYEILSHCSDVVTQTFARGFFAQQRLLHEIVPPELEYRTSVPTALILFDRKMEKSIAGEMVSVMEADGKSTYEGIPQMRLWDADSTGMDFVLDNSHAGDYRDFYLSRDYVVYLLAMRRPFLPNWFIEGATDLYQRATFSEDSIEIDPAIWTSSELTDAIRENPAFPRTLIPMAEFLTQPEPAAGETEEARARFLLWRMQAALFVRWAVDGPGHPHRRAFWNFIGRASNGQVRDAVAREFLGLGFADLDAELNTYLGTAVRTSLVLKASEPDESSQLAMAPATKLEMGRILGDWERKEVAFVKRTDPQDAARYVGQAQLILANATSANPRDPELQAIFGLFECENGDVAHGRALLESAVQGRVTRPSAYLELARLRLADAFANPAGAGGALSADQAASVMDPLRAASAQSPPQRDSDALFTLVLSHTAKVPATP